MDETKIIEAIQQFGTPVWEATRLKVKLIAVTIFVGAGGVAYFMVWSLIKWYRVWQDWLMEAGKCTKCNKEDPTAVKMVFYMLLALFVFLMGAMLSEGLYRWMAVDHYAYKALLP